VLFQHTQDFALEKQASGAGDPVPRLGRQIIDAVGKGEAEPTRTISFAM